MRRFVFFSTALLLLAFLTPAVWAGQSATAPSTANEQSVAAEAPADTGGCSEDGSCCGACKVRQKYAKNKAEPDGLCPCQRARLAREAKEAKQTP